MSNKRNKKRHLKRLSLKFGIDVPNRVGFTQDISFHGLFIRTTNVFPPSANIRIELAMPDNSTVAMEGIVRWVQKVPPTLIHVVKKYGMGVKITRILQGEESYNEFCELLLK